MAHIYGKRIRLRAAEKSDLPDFLRWVNDPDVTENLMLVYPMSEVEEENWYDSMIQRPKEQHVLVIEIEDKGQAYPWKAIGTCQFHNLDWRCRSAEIGIMIGEKRFWNQGYGTETVKLLLQHGFATLNLHRIWLKVYDKNLGGIRAYEKAGFQFEGRFRDGHYQHGRYFDINLMSILRSEWHPDRNEKSEKE
jgi:diamine N-acetyltransferase